MRSSELHSPCFSWTLCDSHQRTINELECARSAGECYYFRPVSLQDVDALDPLQACAHFNQVGQWSRDPSLDAVAFLLHVCLASVQAGGAWLCWGS